MSNRVLRTQSYGGDVALDCWVCGRGGRGSPHGAAGRGGHRRKARLPSRAGWLC